MGWCFLCNLAIRYPSVLVMPLFAVLLFSYLIPWPPWDFPLTFTSCHVRKLSSVVRGASVLFVGDEIEISVRSLFYFCFLGSAILLGTGFFS